MRKEHLLTVWNSKKNYPKKNLTWTLCTLSSVGSLLQQLVTMNRAADSLGYTRKPHLRLPLIKKKAALRYNGEKSRFRLLFHDLEILCPVIRFILLSIISSTETSSEQFWCELEKICCTVCTRHRLRVKMALSLEYDMSCRLCPHTFT